jgi:uncharacterized protein YndB with AHSA1/START domain
MYAKIEAIQDVPVAIFHQKLNHSPKKVWAYLTENNKIKQWFPELEVKALNKGGAILFDFHDGNYEEMEILDVKTEEILEFVWPPKNTVRFELADEQGICGLIFKQFLHEITEHTAKDLAGWHVCLNVIETLLNEQEIRDRKENWEKVYPKYVEIVKPYLNI